MINTSFKLYNLHISAVILTALLVFFETASGQIEKGTDKSIFRGASGVTFGGIQQQWELKDSKGVSVGTLQQQSAPVNVSLPLLNRLLLSISNSGAISTFDTASSTNIVDTRIALSYVFPGEKFWLTGNVSLPTGKTELDAADIYMTSLLGQTAFGYKVPTFGQGLSGNLSMVYAASLTRRMVLGIGLSYFYKGPFKPLKSAGIEYDAGDEISLNIGCDYITYGKNARLSVDLTSTYFMQDKLSGSGAVFESGPRAIATLIYALKTENVNHTLQLRGRYRLQNNFISSNKKYDASMQVEGQYSLGTMLFSGLYGTLVGEGKYYTPDQIPSGVTYIETGNAQILSGGADVTVVSWGWIQPTIGARYAMGAITISGANYDVNGLEANLTFRVTF
jgi:hypothetical protein